MMLGTKSDQAPNKSVAKPTTIYLVQSNWHVYIFLFQSLFFSEVIWLMMLCARGNKQALLTL
jgi:hypothetical protein